MNDISRLATCVAVESAGHRQPAVEAARVQALYDREAAADLVFEQAGDYRGGAGDRE